MARTEWLSDDGESTVIDDHAEKLGTFVAAMADGIIDEQELSDAEERVVALMKKVEPQLSDDSLHADVTKLLVELSAFNVMQMLHEMNAVRDAATTWRP